MSIKIAETFDKADIKKLWADAFSEQEPFLSWYFDNFWKSENSLLKRDEVNRLTGALTLIPYSVIYGGKCVNTSYIAGVSVSENFRNRGIATELMKKALRLQIKRKEPISLLIPFNYDFYRKMGYEVCYERTIADVKHIENIALKSTVPLSLDNFKEMNELYENFCADKNGYILRDELFWKYVLKRLPAQQTYSVGISDGEKLSSYCVFTVEEKRTVVHEIIGNTLEKKTLYSYVTSRYKNVISFLQEDEDIFANCQKVPTVMARVTDVASVFAEFPVKNIKVKICDSFLEENDGIFSLGSNEKTAGNTFDVCMDIKYFTQYFCGFKSCAELFEAGKISGKHEAIFELDLLRKKQKNYINLIMSEDF